MSIHLKNLIREHLQGTLAQEYLQKQGGHGDLLDRIAAQHARQISEEVGTLELLARRLVQGEITL